jgi:hypothetical protein
MVLDRQISRALLRLQQLQDWAARREAKRTSNLRSEPIAPRRYTRAARARKSNSGTPKETATAKRTRQPIENTTRLVVSRTPQPEPNKIDGHAKSSEKTPPLPALN